MSKKLKAKSTCCVSLTVNLQAETENSSLTYNMKEKGLEKL